MQASDEEKDVLCTIIVPLLKVKIENSFELGKFKFVCARFFDAQPELRISNYEGEYLQFKMIVKHRELISATLKIEYSDFLIKRCLSLAEQAMDIMRYQFSSFDRPEFTPNPAGQMDDGFYSVTLFPFNVDPPQINLVGIPFSMTTSNNWLGPELEDKFFRGKHLLSDIINGKSDEISMRIKATLRSCRHSFYSSGDESRFLNLIFTLDGLLDSKDLKAWKHRTYVAAIISAGNVGRFQIILERYDFLYTNVRNKLVHGGKDFYELNVEAASACQDLYKYIQEVIALVEEKGIESRREFHALARSWLLSQPYVIEYTKIISKVDAIRGKQSKRLSW